MLEWLELRFWGILAKIFYQMYHGELVAKSLDLLVSMIKLFSDVLGWILALFIS